MKKRTRWKRVYSQIIGVRFFDGGKYSLGYFTIEKLWVCQEYCKNAEPLSHWVDKVMMQVRTDTGLVYKMPFYSWIEVYDKSGKKSLMNYYYDNNCYMMSKKKFLD